MAYVRITNGTPTRYSLRDLRRDHPKTSFPRNPPDSLLRQYGLYPLESGTAPDHNPDTQRLESGPIEAAKGDRFVQTYTVRALTGEEIAQRERAAAEARKQERAQPDKLIDALEVLTATLVEPAIDDMDPTVVRKLAPLVTQWAPGIPLAAGKVIADEGEVYKTVQAHTTQSDWRPADTPALFTAYRAPDSVTAWVQPAGAHDAYAKGERVSHSGAVWQSDVDGNVWAPGVYGWTEVK